jgi:hypothetical protein
MKKKMRGKVFFFFLVIASLISLLNRVLLFVLIFVLIATMFGKTNIE